MTDQLSPLIRRFEPGASGTSLDRFIEPRGYYIHPNGKSYRVGKLGHRNGHRNITHAEYMKWLDEERRAVGLEPIVRRVMK